jgi:hypothetical protein
MTTFSKTRNWAMLAAVIGLVPLNALAQDDITYVSSDGDEYQLQTRTDDIALVSLYPKSWFIEAGANSHIVREHDVFILNSKCEASHARFGNGTWSWANGGFGISVEGRGVSFPRQEIYMDDIYQCRDN